jgi:hypothetical protein
MSNSLCVGFVNNKQCESTSCSSDSKFLMWNPDTDVEKCLCEKHSTEEGKQNTESFQQAFE